MAPNKFRAIIEDGGRPTQACIMSGSTYVARFIADLPEVDSVWVDLEHGPATVDRLFDLVAAVGHDNCPMVRVPSYDRGIIQKAVMDAGVHGVIVPGINTPEEAAGLAEICAHYAEIRRGRHSGVPDECLAIIQIETVQGYENLEAILGVPGLFAVMPGPTDLSVAFGGPARPYATEQNIAQLRHIVEVAHANGLYAGLVHSDREQMDLVLDIGTDYTIAPGIDMTWLVEGCRRGLALVDEVISERRNGE